MYCQLSDYYFDLPANLIAQKPLEKRSASRMLCLDGVTGTIGHKVFNELPQLLTANDCLILNNTKVIPARCWAKKASGGKVEILLERLLTATSMVAHIGSNRPLQPGGYIYVGEFDEYCLQVDKKEQGMYYLSFIKGDSIMAMLWQYGQVPLPPYINRQPQKEDSERYQTVYAQADGAVAAPTAGLHFDEAILKKLAEMAIPMAYITLHVGAGTFQPVRVRDIRQHKMHAEVISVDQTVCNVINETKARGGRVIAVGTTSLRALESVSYGGDVELFEGETDIFIYPGYKFQCVDALITNFHLPESSLLMLVSAFAGYDLIRQAYAKAIAEQYRFYSYGDSMFITSRGKV